MVKRHGLDAGDDGNVSWVRADLRDPAQAIRGSRQAVQWAEGTIDILVNNAGATIIEDFMDISPESFDEMMAINTRAPLLVSQVQYYLSSCPWDGA